VDNRAEVRLGWRVSPLVVKKKWSEGKGGPSSVKVKSYFTGVGTAIVQYFGCNPLGNPPFCFSGGSGRGVPGSIKRGNGLEGGRLRLLPSIGEKPKSGLRAKRVETGARPGRGSFFSCASCGKRVSNNIESRGSVDHFSP